MAADNRWIERTIVTAMMGALATWGLKTASDLNAIKVQVAEIDARTKGQLQVLSERIETSNRTLFRIEERLDERPMRRSGRE